ncbi:hypothetical protein VPJ68_06615, partial [Parabacteroides distasonis]
FTKRTGVHQFGHTGDSEYVNYVNHRKIGQVKSALIQVSQASLEGYVAKATGYIACSDGLCC